MRDMDANGLNAQSCHCIPSTGHHCRHAEHQTTIMWLYDALVDHFDKTRVPHGLHRGSHMFLQGPHIHAITITSKFIAQPTSIRRWWWTREQQTCLAFFTIPLSRFFLGAFVTFLDRSFFLPLQLASSDFMSLVLTLLLLTRDGPFSAGIERVTSSNIGAASPTVVWYSSAVAPVLSCFSLLDNFFNLQTKKPAQQPMSVRGNLQKPHNLAKELCNGTISKSVLLCCCKHIMYILEILSTLGFQLRFRWQNDFRFMLKGTQRRNMLSTPQVSCSWVPWQCFTMIVQLQASFVGCVGCEIYIIMGELLSTIWLAVESTQWWQAGSWLPHECQVPITHCRTDPHDSGCLPSKLCACG